MRAPERIAPALDPLEVPSPEHVVGDVTEAEAMRRALDGCDAVLHAANVFLFDVRDVARMQQDSRRGTELVLTTVQESGLNPIDHVSSFVAWRPSAGRCDRTLRSAGQASRTRARRSRPSASRRSSSRRARRS